MDDYCFFVKKKLGASSSCFLCIVEYVVDNFEHIVEYVVDNTVKIYLTVWMITVS